MSIEEIEIPFVGQIRSYFKREGKSLVSWGRPFYIGFVDDRRCGILWANGERDYVDARKVLFQSRGLGLVGGGDYAHLCVFGAALWRQDEPLVAYPGHFARPEGAESADADDAKCGRPFA